MARIHFTATEVGSSKGPVGALHAKSAHARAGGTASTEMFAAARPGRPQTFGWCLDTLGDHVL